MNKIMQKVVGLLALAAMALILGGKIFAEWFTGLFE